MQISQEEDKVVLSSPFVKTFPQVVMMYTVKGFGTVNEEVYISLELTCFVNDLTEMLAI